MILTDGATLDSSRSSRDFKAAYGVKPAYLGAECFGKSYYGGVHSAVAHINRRVGIDVASVSLDIACSVLTDKGQLICFDRQGTCG